MSRPKITLVLSMHRSGSSTVAQLIHQLGVHLGDPLHEGREDNPGGFWEYIPLVHLHERMLAFCGSTWYVPGKIPAVEHLLAHFGVEARQLVATMDATGLHWAWKDPRMPLFLAFWMEILKHREVWFLIVTRNSDAAAASLARRDGIPELLSNALWVYSVHNILKYRNLANKHLVLSYEAILADKQKAIGCLYDFLEVHPTEIGKSECVQRVSAIIRPDLSHFQKDAVPSRKEDIVYWNTLLEHQHSQTLPTLCEEYFDRALRTIQGYQQAHFRLKHHANLIRFHYTCAADTPNFTFLTTIDGIRNPFIIKFPNAASIFQLRIGVLNTCAIVQLQHIALYLNGRLQPIPIHVSSNAYEQIESTYYFDSSEPILWLEAASGENLVVDEIHIALEYHQIGLEASQELYKRTKNQFQHLQAVHAALQLEYNSSIRLFKQILSILYRKLKQASGRFQNHSIES